LHLRSRRVVGILSMSLMLASLSAGSALGAAAPPRAAAPVAATTIGPGSCTVGSSPCANATGNIGANSCNGDFACYGAYGNIGNGSCIGTSACEGAGSVGDNSCHGVFSCIGKATVGNCEFNDVEPAACDTQPDARIRRIGRHNMVGDDIYNSNGTNQTLSATLGDGALRFVITVQNDSDTADSFRLSSANGVFAFPTPPVQFLHGWPAQDMSSDVAAGTITTPQIAPGGIYRFRAIVRPDFLTLNRLAAGPTAQFSWFVTATSIGNPADADTVAFTVYIPVN